MIATEFLITCGVSRVRMDEGIPKKPNLWTDKCPMCNQAKIQTLHILCNRKAYDLPDPASSVLHQGVLAVHAFEITLKMTNFCHRTEIISSTLVSRRGLKAESSAYNQKHKVRYLQLRLVRGTTFEGSTSLPRSMTFC